VLPLELKDSVLSDGEIREEVLRCDGGAGGARDFPLPRTLPPPSFRVDIAEGYRVEGCVFRAVQDMLEGLLPF
jgi:hypothetical protein